MNCSLSSAEALPQHRRKSRSKKNAEPLPQNVRFSAQKSRFLACATTTKVQTQEGEFVQRYTCQCRFYHGAKRSSRAGSCSGLRQVSHRIGTIKYWRLINQFNCLILKVRKLHSLLDQSALPLAIRIIPKKRIQVGLIQTPYFTLIPVPLWVIHWKFEWEFFQTTWREITMRFGIKCLVMFVLMG